MAACGFLEGALLRWKSGKLTNIGYSRGLAKHGMSLVDDETGRLWMGTSTGILVLSKQELNESAEGGRGPTASLLVGLNQGMRDAECNTVGNRNSATRTRDGRLGFATGAGAAVIDPGRFTTNKMVARKIRSKAATSLRYSLPSLCMPKVSNIWAAEPIASRTALPD